MVPLVEMYSGAVPKFVVELSLFVWGGCLSERLSLRHGTVRYTVRYGTVVRSPDAIRQ